ncbi:MULTISPECIES: hypothetical protein [Chelativorans]|jgi:hypothetical protein|uniref:hypothetical protein n=1 Tax=Chelativorans TaxID=449972 RepID=UPI0005A19A10|nr:MULTISPECIES: hypothetical protein [Chelativorans]
MPDFPKTREAAKGTATEWAWETPDHWPRSIRRVSLDDDGLGLDPTNGGLYWQGQPLVTEKRWSTTERRIAIAGLLIASIGVAATVVQAWAAVCASPAP